MISHKYNMYHMIQITIVLIIKFHLLWQRRAPNSLHQRTQFPGRHWRNPEYSGLIPRSFYYIFHLIEQRQKNTPSSNVQITASYLEIYNEQVGRLFNQNFLRFSSYIFIMYVFSKIYYTKLTLFISITIIITTIMIIALLIFLPIILFLEETIKTIIYM